MPEKQNYRAIRAVSARSLSFFLSLSLSDNLTPTARISRQTLGRKIIQSPRALSRGRIQDPDLDIARTGNRRVRHFREEKPRSGDPFRIVRSRASRSQRARLVGQSTRIDENRTDRRTKAGGNERTNERTRPAGREEEYKKRSGEHGE